MRQHIVHLPGEPLPFGQCGRPGSLCLHPVQFDQEPLGLRDGLAEAVREKDHAVEAREGDRAE